MHPISYSLIINILSLVICGALALFFNQPLLVVVAILAQTHAIDRFRPQEPSRDDDDEDQPMGFTASVK